MPLPALPDNPTVTVVVPSYNQQAFIEETILSVLEQDYENIELIIVDGASTDGTSDILRKYESDPRVCCISEPDQGPHSAINKGLKLSRGDLIGVQMSSDTYQPGALREAVREFVADPLLGFVGGLTQEIDVEGLTTGRLWCFPSDEPFISVDEVIKMHYPGIQASFFRRELVLAIGGFTEELQVVHSFSFRFLMLEALRLGMRLRRVPRVWANFRRHPQARHDHPSIHAEEWREREVATKLTVARYKDWLGKEGSRAVRRMDCYQKLVFLVKSRRPITQITPVLISFLWFGGRPRFKVLVAESVSILYFRIARTLLRAPRMYCLLKSVKKRFAGSRSDTAGTEGVVGRGKLNTDLAIDTRWYLPSFSRK